MRLLYVCNDFGIPLSGTKGASVHVRSITRALADLGHDVLILGANVGDGPEPPSVPVCSLESPRAAKTVRSLKRWLKANNADPSFARELRPLLNGAQALELVGDRIASFRPDAVIERLSLFSTFGGDVASQYRVPFVVEANAHIADEAKRYRALQMFGLASALEYTMLERADRVLAVSRVLAGQLELHGVPRAKIHVVPNGVDLGLFESLPSREEARAALGIGHGFVLGFVGSLKPWHGVETLMRAFRKLKNRVASAKLVLVGSGPQATRLQELAQTLRLTESVRFTGAVPHREIPRWLRAFDVAVAPYENVGEFYFSPLKLFEYMAAGTCVVASRVGQIEDVVADGVNGLLCRAGDVDDLATALELAHASPHMRRELGSKAEALVGKKFTWGRVAEATVQVLTACMGVPVANRASGGASVPLAGVAQV